MSTDAMRAALEALEGWDNYDKWVWPESALEQAKRNTAEALTLLRAALAQPVSAERVPLTDEQIASATSHVLGHAPGYYVTIARAIERAHGIGEPK